MMFRGLGKRNSFGDGAVGLDLHILLRDVPVAPLLPAPLWGQHLLCRSPTCNRESREGRGASYEVSALVKAPFPLCTHLNSVSSSSGDLRDRVRAQQKHSCSVQPAPLAEWRKSGKEHMLDLL